MGNKRFSCPSCDSPLQWHSSRMIHSLMRHSYAQCTNPLCSASWTIATEIVKNVSPPSPPFTNPLPSRGIQHLLYDLAVQYLEQQGKGGTQQGCIEYLVARANAQTDDAKLATHQAFISRDDTHDIVINTAKTNSSSTVIKIGGREHVISTKDMLQLVPENMVK